MTLAMIESTTHVHAFYYLSLAWKFSAFLRNRKKNFIQEQSSRMVRPQQTENVFHIFLEFPANEEFHVWCSNMSFLQEFSRIVSTAHKSFTSPVEQCTKIIFLRFLSSASLFPTSQLLLLLIMTFILMFYFCFCLRSF